MPSVTQDTGTAAAPAAPSQEPPSPSPMDSADAPAESRLGRMGVRAALVLLLLGTACAVALLAAIQSFRAQESPQVIEPVASLSLLAVGYYFGQKNISKP